MANDIDISSIEGIDLHQDMNRKITREEMVDISFIIFGITIQDPITIEIICDDMEDIRESSYKNMVYALSYDTVDISDNKIRPHDYAKRSEAAYLLARIIINIIRD